jgi:hypothetical protein
MDRRKWSMKRSNNYRWNSEQKGQRKQKRSTIIERKIRKGNLVHKQKFSKDFEAESIYIT